MRRAELVWFLFRLTIKAEQKPDQFIDGHGRFLEMCAVRSADSRGWVVYHAMKATRKVLHEVGLI